MASKTPDLGKEYCQKVRAFLRGYGIRPKKIETVYQAFSHKSFSHEARAPEFNNERLEFLGDAVIELIVSRFLYLKFPGLEEGQLTRLRSAVVNAKRLSECAREIGIDKLLLLAKSAEKSGDRKRNSVLSDAFESLVGALYLTCSYRTVQKFVLGTLRPDEVNWSDPKSELQEFSQAKYRCIPGYRIVRTTGPQHRKNFIVEVTVGDKTFGPASGNTKKDAEQAAARLALGEFFGEDERQ